METKLILRYLASGNKAQRAQVAALLNQPPALSSLGLVGGVTGGLLFLDSNGQVLGATATAGNKTVRLTAEQFSQCFATGSMPEFTKFSVPPGTADTKSDPIE